mmetsp:Transcript_30170/g.64053  ORF Transcript_30170/g.64053 Transcript_30170/m.64053 type:complete len:99 (+) Transcript_30170:256-552(+)
MVGLVDGDGMYDEPMKGLDGLDVAGSDGANWANFEGDAVGGPAISAATGAPMGAEVTRPEFDKKSNCIPKLTVLSSPPPNVKHSVQPVSGFAELSASG